MSRFHTGRLASLALLSLLAGASFAQSAPPPPVAASRPLTNLETRQAREQSRIAAGAQSGELTGKEVGRLERQQARLDAAKSAAEADGVVTGKERRSLVRKEERAQKNIHKQRSDQQGVAR